MAISILILQGAIFSDFFFSLDFIPRVLNGSLYSNKDNNFFVTLCHFNPGKKTEKLTEGGETNVAYETLEPETPQFYLAFRKQGRSLAYLVVFSDIVWTLGRKNFR